MKTGRPPGPTKLKLTSEISAELARRVRLRAEVGLRHSNKALAADYGVSEAAIVGALVRLRKRGLI